MSGTTLFEKIWAKHVIRELPDGGYLLHVDRHFIHDIEAGPRLRRIEQNGYTVRRPDLTFAVPDHVIASSPGRTTDTNPTSGRLLRDMRKFTAKQGIRMFDLGQRGQGIVHIVGPELGLTIPGAFIVCGDSHTCTHGGLGALAFGIGSSEAEHVLATQTIRQRKPRTLRLTFDGDLGAGVTAKDLILFAIGKFGTAAGRGYAVEYAGSTVRALEIEQRLTLCNLSIEMGAKIGMIAPDQKAFDYVRGRPYAPVGELFERALAQWQNLHSDDDAHFDLELTVDSRDVTPQITWGTSPEHVISVAGTVPDPAHEPDEQRRAGLEDALRYMGLRANQAIAGVRIDRVFIGSCANSRLSDLREAAHLVKGKKVAAHVVAWVVPGSVETRDAAQREGLHTIFLDAGFEWREPSCSMCLAANGDIIEPGQRSVSTSNRNFVGRQGPGARTHLASPAMAAAAAIAGEICDLRGMEVHA